MIPHIVVLVSVLQAAASLSLFTSTSRTCTAQWRYSFYPHPHGFGSRVNNLMNELAEAESKNLSAAFHSTEPFLKTWQVWFRNTIPICDAESKRFNDGRLRSTWKNRGRNDPEGTTKIKRDVYKRHYVHSEHAKSRINRRLDAFHLPDDFIGVHIRHGDKASEADPVDTEEYAGPISQETSTEAHGHTLHAHASPSEHAYTAAKIILKYDLERASLSANTSAFFREGGIKTVWLATLDKAAWRILSETLGAGYKVVQLAESLDDWNNHLPGQVYGPNSTHFEDLVVDIEALRRSKLFICTASSNLGRLVYFLRNPGSESISMDEDFLSRGA